MSEEPRKIILLPHGQAVGPAPRDPFRLPTISPGAQNPITGRAKRMEELYPNQRWGRVTAISEGGIVASEVTGIGGWSETPYCVPLRMLYVGCTTIHGFQNRDWNNPMILGVAPAVSRGAEPPPPPAIWRHWLVDQAASGMGLGAAKTAALGDGLPFWLWGTDRNDAVIQLVVFMIEEVPHFGVLVCLDTTFHLKCLDTAGAEVWTVAVASGFSWGFTTTRSGFNLLVDVEAGILCVVAGAGGADSGRVWRFDFAGTLVGTGFLDLTAVVELTLGYTTLHPNWIKCAYTGRTPATTLSNAHKILLYQEDSNRNLALAQSVTPTPQNTALNRVDAASGLWPKRGGSSIVYPIFGFSLGTGSCNNNLQNTASLEIVSLNVDGSEDWRYVESMTAGENLREVVESKTFWEDFETLYVAPNPGGSIPAWQDAFARWGDHPYNGIGVNGQYIGAYVGTPEDCTLTAPPLVSVPGTGAWPRYLQQLDGRYRLLGPLCVTEGGITLVPYGKPYTWLEYGTVSTAVLYTQQYSLIQNPPTPSTQLRRFLAKAVVSVPVQRRLLALSPTGSVLWDIDTTEYIEFVRAFSFRWPFLTTGSGQFVYDNNNGSHSTFTFAGSYNIPDYPNAGEVERCFLYGEDLYTIRRVQDTSQLPSATFQTRGLHHVVEKRSPATGAVEWSVSLAPGSVPVPGTTWTLFASVGSGGRYLVGTILATNGITNVSAGSFLTVVDLLTGTVAQRAAVSTDPQHFVSFAGIGTVRIGPTGVILEDALYYPWCDPTVNGGRWEVRRMAL